MKTPARILIVDDSPDLRSATVRMVDRAGYAASEAGGGLAALERTREFRPDLLLLDVDLHGMCPACMRELYPEVFEEMPGAHANTGS